jgi:serine/threonine protein kinase
MIKYPKFTKDRLLLFLKKVAIHTIEGFIPSPINILFQLTTSFHECFLNEDPNELQLAITTLSHLDINEQSLFLNEIERDLGLEVKQAFMLLFTQLNHLHQPPINTTTSIQNTIYQHLTIESILQETPSKPLDQQELIQKALTQYQMKYVLGQGSSATVYAAWSEKYQRIVALKIGRLYSQESLQRELHFLFTLKHPQVVDIYEYGDIEIEGHSFFWIALECCGGYTLEQYIQSRLKENARFMLGKMMDVANVLIFFEQKQIVHRDLKPSNLLFNSHLEIKISDFGLSKSISMDQNQSINIGMKGTPYYMSPAQIRGEKADCSFDLWAFAVIIFEIISGQKPFQGPTIGVIFSEILNTTPNFQLIPNEFKSFIPFLQKVFTHQYTNNQQAMHTFLEITQDYLIAQDQDIIDQIYQNHLLLSFFEQLSQDHVDLLVLFENFYHQKTGHPLALFNTEQIKKHLSLTHQEYLKTQQIQQKISLLQKRNTDDLRKEKETYLYQYIKNQFKNHSDIYRLEELIHIRDQELQLFADECKKYEKELEQEIQKYQDTLQSFHAHCLNHQYNQNQHINIGQYDLKMIYCDARIGFYMGTNDLEADHDAKPKIKVYLSKPFFISEILITEGIWQTVYGIHPQINTNQTLAPKVYCSWEDCMDFCNQLSKKQGLKEVYIDQKIDLNANGYRLATEAEWSFCVNGLDHYLYAGSNQLEEVAWYEGNSQSSIHPVKQKKSNALGLYDMSGNVWEWCLDQWNKNQYKECSNTDPFFEKNQQSRVIRGGAANSHAQSCLSYYRNRADQKHRDKFIGFRIVRFA